MTRRLARERLGAVTRRPELLGLLLIIDPARATVEYFDLYQAVQTSRRKSPSPRQGPLLPRRLASAGPIGPPGALLRRAASPGPVHGRPRRLRLVQRPAPPRPLRSDPARRFPAPGQISSSRRIPGSPTRCCANQPARELGDRFGARRAFPGRALARVPTVGVVRSPAHGLGAYYPARLIPGVGLVTFPCSSRRRRRAE